MGILKTLTINGVSYNIAPIVPAASVTLLAAAWEGEGEVYSQVVEVPGVTAHTMVDLQPTAEQLAEFLHKVLGFVAENDGGVVTVFSVGERPMGDHTIQITKTEVEGTGKIRGNTVGTPTSPAKMEKELKPVKTVNGQEPDEQGNVVVGGGSAELPTVTAIDLSNFENGSFTETAGGVTITHTVTFDTQGRPTKIDDIAITWGAVT